MKAMCRRTLEIGDAERLGSGAGSRFAGRYSEDEEGKAKVVRTMVINDAGVVAELKALYPQYEAALVRNDVETLTRMFWGAPEVMRFGVTENLYGIAEIEAFRRGRSAANLARRVKRLDIVTFGQDFASITLEFERLVDAQIVAGRQSQTWVRMPEGWRIVAAHVSLLK